MIVVMWELGTGQCMRANAVTHAFVEHAHYGDRPIVDAVCAPFAFGHRAATGFIFGSQSADR